MKKIGKKIRGIDMLKECKIYTTNVALEYLLFK